jgi:hemoglobin-like flavoprotein
MDELEAVMSDLGEKHRKLGVLPEYFPIFCDVMLEVLANSMGKDWTYELESAWEEVLGGLSKVLVSSMQKK